MKRCLTTLLFTSIIGLFIPIMAISPAMKKDAHSVVNLDRKLIQCNSLTNSTETYTYIITILDANGDNAAHFSTKCSQFEKLDKFSGTVTDTLGNIIKKFSKSDLNSSEYSQALAEGNITYFLECYVPQYPYRVEYKWQVSNENGIIAFPSLSPQSYFAQSVEKSDYKLIVPQEMGCRFYESGVKNAVNIGKDDSGKIIVTASLKNIKAIPSGEQFSCDIDEIIPKIRFAPTNFIFDKHPGSLSTWESLGEWESLLLKEAEAPISEELKVKLHALTDTCKTDRSKVKCIYNLLENTTRYVSIQLGIGGYKPISPIKTFTLGFGDCKALSFYMKSMLNEIGIRSDYVTISTIYRDLIPGFANMEQMNHAILRVPLVGDTLWLECTNPSLPFGYIHNSIAGHNALVIKDGKGVMARVPEYPSNATQSSINYDVTVNPDFSGSLNVSEHKSLRFYEGNELFAELTPNGQIEQLRRRSSINNCTIKNIKSTRYKSCEPVFITDYVIEAPKLGKSTGIRLFLPINPIRSNSSRYDCVNRTIPFELAGEVYADTINITIPEGFAIETMPKSVSLKSDFGTISAIYSQEGNRIKAIQNWDINRTRQPASKNAEFTTFYNSAIAMWNAKMVIKKQ